jgi:hypothetical protein
MHVSQAGEELPAGEVARRISTWAADLVRFEEDVGGSARACGQSELRGVAASCRPFEGGDWLEPGGGSCAPQRACGFWQRCEEALNGGPDRIEQSRGGSAFGGVKPLRNEQ